MKIWEKIKSFFKSKPEENDSRVYSRGVSNGSSETDSSLGVEGALATAAVYSAMSSDCGRSDSNSFDGGGCDSSSGGDGGGGGDSGGGFGGGGGCD